MTGPVIAYAVVHDDPPIVYMAEDLDVLHRALALNLVGRAGAETFDGHRDAVRQALLDERWGDAVVAWMEATDTVRYGSCDSTVPRPSISRRATTSRAHR